MTYGEIANIIANQKGVERMSAQAVGGAVGHNPISIIIPCHRVVGGDGSLTGYTVNYETEQADTSNDVSACFFIITLELRVICFLQLTACFFDQIMLQYVYTILYLD